MLIMENSEIFRALASVFGFIGGASIVAGSHPQANRPVREKARQKGTGPDPRKHDSCRAAHGLRRSVV